MATGQDLSYRHILKYTGIFGGVQGFQLVMGLLRTKLMAILLAPSGMGLVSLLLRIKRSWRPRYILLEAGVC